MCTKYVGYRLGKERWIPRNEEELIAPNSLHVNTEQPAAPQTMTCIRFTK